jgi:DNA-binding MarR family transcriptional regulator
MSSTTFREPSPQTSPDSSGEEAPTRAEEAPTREDSPAALAGEVPIDVAETAARLRLAVLRLSRKIRQQVAQEVTQSQVSVLSSVESRGNPTLGELAVAEDVRPPSMTRQVDTLVSGGLLERTVDLNDRRVARVELTPAGRKALQRSRSLRTAYMVRRIAKLSDEDQRRAGELVDLLELLAGTESKSTGQR